MVREIALAVCIASCASASVVQGVASAIGFQTPAPAKNAESVTPADVVPFLGEWSLALQGPNGPGTFDLSIRIDKEKPAADITSEQLPKQPITGFSMVQKSLAMNYSFTWEGNPVDAVVTLTPADDKSVKAQIDFAGGAYIMTGTATKKEAVPKPPR
jgi:hypothetical protein